MSPYAHKTLDDGAGFDDRPFSQLQYTLYDRCGVNTAVAASLQVLQGMSLSLQALPWGQILHGSLGKRV